MKRPPFSSAFVGIFAIFVFALGLRLVGLTWGLPNAERWYSYHADESFHQLGGAVVSVIGGDPNPHFFNYPSLVVYLTSFVYFVASGLGLTSAPIAPSFWNTLHDIVLCGRVVSAVLGAATMFPVYGLGKALLRDSANKPLGKFAGLVAALLLALTPGHVQHSHFATVDVPATFFVALCLWLSARACQSDAPLKWLLWAGLVAGLAAATKYNAVLVLIAPLGAAWLGRRDASLLKAVPLTVGLAVMGFLVGCPYALLSFSEFWGKGDQGFAYELLRHPREGSGDIFLQTGNGWVYHFLVNAPYLLTWPLLTAALAGVVLVLWRGTGNEILPIHRRVAAILLLFAGLYFVSLGFSQVRFMRYLLPLCPALCVLAAWTVTRCMAAFPGEEIMEVPKIGVVVCFGAIVFWGASYALIPFAKTDPRDQAVRFLSQSAPSQNVTVGLVGPPWFWTPSLQPRGDNIPIDASPDGHYQFVYTGFSTAKLEAEKPQYFVMSEYEWMEKQRLGDSSYLAFKKALDRDYAKVGDFQLRLKPFLFDLSHYAPHDYLYTNPEVLIYKRKKA